MLYGYVLVVTGQVEAPTEEHARLQALMGVTVTARLLQSPHSVGVEVGPVDATAEINGQRPNIMEH